MRSRLREFGKCVGAKALLLALALIAATATADEVDELYSEIELLLSKPNGNAELRVKASAIKEELADVLLDDEPERVEKAAFLMRYAEPGQSWDSAIAAALAADEKNRVEAAISVLGVHGPVGRESRDELTSLIQEAPSNRIFSDTARIAGRASMKEVIPFLEDALWEEDVERNAGAVLGLIEFGPEASEVVPSLEKRLRQLEDREPSGSAAENYLNNLPIPNQRKNLKGLLQKAIATLSETPKPIANGTGEQKRDAPTEPMRAENPQSNVETSKEAKLGELSESDSRTPVWLYVLVAFAVVGIVVVVLRARRNNTGV